MPNQANTQRGKIVLASNSNLTGLEGKLVKIVSNAGGPGLFDVPAAVTDEALFVLTDGNLHAGDPCEAIPLHSEQEVRVVATGTGVAGARVIHDSAAYGSVKTDPGTSATTVFSPGIAEEDWVAGQALLIRPAPRTIVHP